MKNNWFWRYGIIFIPASLTGWIIALSALAYCVYSFIEIDSRSHSVSDTLMNFVFRVFLVYIAFTAIALLTGKNASSDNT
jgi:cytochrome b subunit of formate dehydrogenase